MYTLANLQYLVKKNDTHVNRFYLHDIYIILLTNYTIKLIIV
jgi:hypothetical protein